MKYSIRTDNRIMTVVPVNGDTLDYFTDLLIFTELARSYGCSTLDYCGSTLDIKNFNNPMKLNNSEFLIETNSESRAPIVRFIEDEEIDSIRIRFIDGREVIYGLPTEHLLRLLKKWKVMYVYNINPKDKQKFNNRAHVYDMGKYYAMIIKTASIEEKEEFESEILG